MKLRDLMKKEQIGFDILCDSKDNIEKEDNYFYKNDILKRDKILYVK